MNFTEIKLGDSYDSDEDDILNGFYIPLLSNSIEYRRLAGFFSSASLAVAAEGISGFIKNNGKIKLVVGAILSKQDIEAIRLGSMEPEKAIEDWVIKDLDNIKDEIIKNHVKALAWLLAKDRLEIKVAIMKNKKGELLSKGEIERKGIFHLKTGIFTDQDGNRISFSGTINETAFGWNENIEDFKVFKSWIQEERKFFDDDERRFNKYWFGEGKNVDIIDAPEAIRRKLVSLAPKYYRDLNLDFRSIHESLSISIPKHIEIRPYQQQAVENWFENDGKGIFKMATGTGKTITALSLIAELYKRNNKKLAIIIACPYKHLVNQWRNIAGEFNLSPILGYESYTKWEVDLNSKITAFNIDAIDSFSLITTHTTFKSDLMLKSLQKLEGTDVILVVDEVHHLNGTKLLSYGLDQIKFRLGLSATPEDWYNEENTNDLLSFIGDIVFEYNIEDAIKNNWLSPYFYYPHIVELTSDELDEYYEISEKISKQYAIKEDLENSDDDYLMNLLIQRARLLGKAKNKLSILKKLLLESRNDTHLLIYCGDGKYDDERQIEKVVKIVGHELGMHVNKFTANESPRVRQELLSEFENGNIQALVAIKCLDEGVDVPATKTAYILASSRNPRQFIQRRGRILRKHKNKQFSTIHDMIVIPRDLLELENIDYNQYNVERQLLKRELERVSWFTRSAENGPQAEEKLLEIKKKYSLLDM